MTSSRLIFALVLLGGALGCGTRPPPPPIVVGHVANLTGPDKRAGIQASLGISLALDEVNKDAERRIEVRHTDAQGKLDSFETQAIRLLALSPASNPLRALLGGDNPAEVLRLDRAVQPGTEEKPVFVPILSPCGWRTGTMSKQVIIVGMTPQPQGKVLVRYAVEKLNVARLAILVDQADERAQTLAEVVVREFVEVSRKQQPGKEPLRPRTLPYGADAKLTDLLAQIIEEKPQAVLVAGRPADLRLTYEKLTQLGAKSKSPPPALLFGGEDGSGDWPVLPLKEGVPAIYLASAFGLDRDNAGPESFEQRFRKRFQEEPDVHAALAYESMKLLAEPLRNGGDSVKLREELFKIKDFAGLAGPLNIDGDQVVVRSLVMLRLDRDQLSVMKQ